MFWSNTITLHQRFFRNLIWKMREKLSLQNVRKSTWCNQKSELILISTNNMNYWCKRHTIVERILTLCSPSPFTPPTFPHCKYLGCQNYITWVPFFNKTVTTPHSFTANMYILITSLLSLAVIHGRRCHPSYLLTERQNLRMGCG